MAVSTLALCARAHTAESLLVVLAAAACCLLATAASYAYTTRYGKFRAWFRVLSDLGLRGDERVLDLGCGRGGVLLMVARMLPRGRAVGIDLWSRSDQSGNCEAATHRNAVLEGVGDRVELHTGDMRSLPFSDETFDVVLSNLAIHNLGEPKDRERAIDEAIRVLKRSGRVAIADLLHASEYAERLSRRGLADVTQRSLGPGCWFGGPWAATRIVMARRPG